MRKSVIAAAFGLALLARPAMTQELQFPQIIRTHYEALDPKLGGQFVLWSERERVVYGLDPRLYPGALTVNITQVTTSPGSSAMTYIEIRTTLNHTPDHLYFVGPARFRMSGMRLKSSNFPAGSMSPQP
jgi:hypothetical protein